MAWNGVCSVTSSLHGHANDTGQTPDDDASNQAKRAVPEQKAETVHVLL
jgi:hypothetical protein